MANRTEKCSKCGEKSEIGEVPDTLVEDVIWECPKCGTRNVMEAEEVTHVAAGDGGSGGDVKK